jgi:hypothetical protein
MACRGWHPLPLLRERRAYLGGVEFPVAYSVAQQAAAAAAAVGLAAGAGGQANQGVALEVLAALEVRAEAQAPEEAEAAAEAEAEPPEGSTLPLLIPPQPAAPGVLEAMVAPAFYELWELN